MAYSVDIVLAPAAQAVEDGPTRLLNGLCHGVEAIEGYKGRAEAAHVIAVVVLEVVDAPVGETLSVGIFVVEGSGYISTVTY